MDNMPVGNIPRHQEAIQRKKIEDNKHNNDYHFEKYKTQNLFHVVQTQT